MRGGRGFEVEFLLRIDLQQQQKDAEPLTSSRNLGTVPRLQVQLWLTMNKQTNPKVTSRMQDSEHFIMWQDRGELS